MSAWVSKRSGDWTRASNNADSPWHDGGAQTALSSYPGGAGTGDTVTIGDGVTASQVVTLDANPANSLASITNGDNTSYIACATERTITLTGATGIACSSTAANGFIRVTAHVLTIVGGGTGTKTIVNSGSGKAVRLTGSGGLILSDADADAIVENNTTNGTAIDTLTTSGSVTLVGHVASSGASGYAVVNNSGNSGSFTGTITCSANGNGIRVVNGTWTITPTGAIISGAMPALQISGGTVTIDGLPATSGKQPVVFSNGTTSLTGARTLAASADTYMIVEGGTLNLATASAKLALANSGSFVINLVSGTLNTADAGAGAASIVNQTANSYAAIVGGTDAQKAIITGPVIPAEEDVEASVEYGYAGDLQTGTLAMLSEAQMEAILDARGLTEPASDTADSVARRGANAVTLSDVGSGGGAMHSTTIATLASQTSFTLTAGSADDDAYNYCVVVVTDESTATQKCVGVISDYTGSSKTVTLGADPAIFTMAAGDTVEIYPPADLRWINGTVASGAATVDANLTRISGDETAADTLELFVEALDQATGQLDSGSLAAGTITAATFAADVDDEVRAWIVDNSTGDGVRIDSAALNTCTGVTIPAIKDKTDNLPSDPADQSAVEAAITAAASDLDDQLTAIGGTVDSLSSGVTVSDKTGFKLASDGLDAIATTAPSGPATTFREMVVQTWRWFFKRATKTSESLVTYADDGTTPITTQAITASGTDEERGAAT